MERFSVIQIVSPPSTVTGGKGGITGPERRAANLAQHWKSQGIDLTVLYPRRGLLWEEFSDAGVSLVDFEVHGKWDWRSLARVRSEIRRTRASIIHTQGGPAVDLVAVTAAHLTGIKSVVTRPVMIEDQIDRSAVGLYLSNKVDRLYILAKCDAIIAVSRDGFDRLAARTAPDKVHLVYNGVKSRSFPVDRSYRTGDATGEVQVGMIGHLRPYKGWSDFLRVAQRVSAAGLNVRWHIVGEGPERPRLESLALELGIAERVMIHGVLKDVSPLLQELDVFLFTSYREGLSVAVLEAMSEGLPIVATDVAGIRDQVTDGFNGYILPPGDVDGLFEKCHFLLLRPDERLRMGRNSRKRVEESFTEGAMRAGYVDIYRRLVSLA